MASFNKVIIMGNLVRDPELRVTPSGISVGKITVACSRVVKSEKAENGIRKETTFIDVEIFGKLADSIAKFFAKGKPILLDGRLRLNEWTNQAGEKRSKLVVVMDTFSFVGSSQNSGAIKADSADADENIGTCNDMPNKGIKDDAGSFVDEEDVPF